MKKRGRRKKKNRYDWREGNSFELLKDGDRFLPPMLEAIRSSADYVLLEMYLLEPGELTRLFVDALSKAAARGVSVYLLLDGYGAMGLAMDDVKHLENSGARLAWFNPLRYRKWRGNLHRDHRKLLLVDGELAFTGGFGVSDEFSPDYKRGLFWRETMVEIRGPVVADWQDSFRRIWTKWSESPILLKPPKGAPLQSGQPGRTGRVSISEYSKKEVIPSLIKHIRGAKRRIWLTTAYFIPTWKIRRALRKAARRGIDVRILLPGPVTDHQPVRRIGHLYYHSLLRNGIRIFEYEPRFLHAKVLICDDWVSVGSSNLDRWCMRWNMEANQEVLDPEFANDAAEIFMGDIAESREISAASWVRRPWRRRLMESFYGLVLMWIEYFAHLNRFRLAPSSRKSLKAILPPWLGKRF